MKEEKKKEKFDVIKHAILALSGKAIKVKEAVKQSETFSRRL